MTSSALGTVIVTSTMGMPALETASAANCASSLEERRTAGIMPNPEIPARTSSRVMADRARPSGAGREYALQRDDEVQAEEGLKVIVRLVPAGDAQSGRVHVGVGLGIGGGVSRGRGFQSRSPGVVRRVRHSAGSGALRGVVMLGHFALEQSDGRFPADLAEIPERESGTLAGLHGRAALQVGKLEIALAIAAVGGSEERKQRGVLRERQDLPVTQRPPLGREVSGEDSNFGEKWIRHECPLRSGWGKFPAR